MSNRSSPRPLDDRAVQALIAGNAILLVLLFGYVGSSVKQIPDRPVFDGTSDFANPGVVHEVGDWLVLPLCAAGFAVLLVALALLEPRLRLHRFGMQQRARFEALPAPQQWPLIRSVMLLILTIAALDTMVLGAMQLAILDTEQSPPRWRAEWVVGAAGVVYPLVCVGWLLVLRRHLMRALADPAKS